MELSKFTGTRTEVDVKIQIDGTVRDATAEEAAVIEARRTQLAQIEAAAVARVAAREAALAKLGLTAQEIAAVFG